MKIGLIGAGKAGFSLGRFFAEGGLQLTGYFSRQPESARAAAQFTHSRPYENPGELLADSDAIFLTVPDGAITDVYRMLRPYGLSGKQLCHCSGAITAGEAFPDIGSCGACGYSIHPLFPISSKLEAYRELPGAFFCIEGDGPHLSLWRDTLRALGPTVQILPAGQKACYHAACVIASNLVCALIDESMTLLETCGFSRQQALLALTPLIRSNTEHILHSGPVQALTGPVERGDIATVRRHLAGLPGQDSVQLYRAVSRRLIETARARHPETDYSALEAVLKEGMMT